MANIHLWQFDLSQGRTRVEEDLWGDHIYAIRATSILAEIKVHPNGGDGIPFARDQAQPLPEFDHVEISNEVQAGEKITLQYGFNPGMSVSRPAESLQSVKLSGLSTVDSLDDVSIPAGSSKKVIDADPTRRKVILSNPEANSREFRIGDQTNVGPSNGFELNPG